MINCEVGNFITISNSSKPALIINKTNNSLLVSIDEYNGDYIWVNANNALNTILSREEELSILANFGSWFYDQHKLLYQEKIIIYITNLLVLHGGSIYSSPSLSP